MCGAGQDFLSISNAETLIALDRFAFSKGKDGETLRPWREEGGAHFQKTFEAARINDSEFYGSIPANQLSLMAATFSPSRRPSPNPLTALEHSGAFQGEVSGVGNSGRLAVYPAAHASV